MTTDPLSEHSVFRAFLGEPRGAAVLDLGRTAPELERWALDGGAAYTGLDLADLERWSGVGLGSFDLVVSWMALHRVRNLARLLETARHHTARDGRLVLAVPHPVVTAAPHAAPNGTPNGAPGPAPDGAVRLSGYFDEGERTWDGAMIWHRTLEGYLYELRVCGFGLVELSEGRRMRGAPAGGAVPAPRQALFRCRRATF
ncbi:bifunctional 2-polyprenyl-6-hydroxyphenol methylase/3-demethylubiquinol 3-O-methyltransferase UbiG [Actinomadura sp. WMMB 499]|uniref:class I SAM-dependent methyltransferase n=1 Tax=Actinomadura sp. WMMB 499 TaxID=1219491 RepID=UPI001244A69A|nr:class I SAM-dependent methyltransferase [Actinomadura sp. WMMB 499]QFG22955.1 class I SAM-dependent methyltransferase [Actinomadura sp. WMMB 499]